jgi:hypothetical protein
VRFETPTSGQRKREKVMNRILFCLALVLALAVTPRAFAQGGGGPKPGNPDRLQGMKVALADIEKGFLKIKGVPPPAPPWEGEYLKLLRTECGIDVVYVSYEESSDPRLGAQMAGYNAVMLLEIEHRHGKGVLGRLGQKAMDDYLKAKQGK